MITERLKKSEETAEDMEEAIMKYISKVNLETEMQKKV